MTDVVLRARSGRVVTLTLHRPERLNAVSLPLYEALIGLLDEADADSEVRCVVMTTKGCRGGAAWRTRLACAHAASSKAHRILGLPQRICFGRNSRALDGSPLSARMRLPRAVLRAASIASCTKPARAPLL